MTDTMIVVAPAENPALVLLSKASEEYGFTKKYLSKMVKDGFLTPTTDDKGNTYLIRNQLAAGGLDVKRDVDPGPTGDGRTARDPAEAVAAMALADSIERVAEAVNRLEQGMAAAFEAVIQEQKQQHAMLLAAVNQTPPAQHSQQARQATDPPADSRAAVAALDGLLLLYQDNNAWAKGALAINDANQSVDPRSPAASAWSLLGALRLPQYEAAAPAILGLLARQADGADPEQVLQERNDDTGRINDIRNFLSYVRGLIAPDLAPLTSASYPNPNPTARGFAGFGSEPNPSMDGVGIAIPAERPFGALNPNLVRFGVGRDGSVYNSDGAFHQF